MDTAVSVRAVHKTFGTGPAQVEALRGIDLDVQRGELVLLMGPSGSGKTTLLTVMGCMLKPSSGQVQIAGREVTALSERELPAIRLAHIGFVFQGFNLFPTLTAGENIELLLDLKGLSRSAARYEAARLLEQVELCQKYGAYPDQLSGGQKQRVAIARALAGDPAIVLADEPTAALDSRTGRQVMQILRSLAQQRGRAVVVVSHDPRVLEFADRRVEIEDGRIVAPNAASAELPLPARSSSLALLTGPSGPKNPLPAMA
jgi:putative ABC transport system ATP-binding protein